MIVGRDCVGDIVFLCGSSARASIAAVVQVENAETILSDQFDSGCAIGGIGGVAMKVKNGRLVIPRRRMPGNQCDAIGNRDLDFP